MKVVTYTKPHPTNHPGLWVIGWSHAWREKCRSYTFARGTEAEAQAKIDATSGEKFKTRLEGVYKV